ncbi:MAG: flagellar basal body P-ring formation chaperone FlgA [Gammaproteobacteria bacterium]
MQGPADLVADELDPRLRLKRCTQPLAATVPANGVGATRVTAEVRCAGKQPWRLFLPVQISATRSVVVAARSLARDTVLAPGDVRLAESVSGSAPTGAVRDPAFAVGRRLKRQVNEGQALTAGLLAAATVIQRGQDVTVEARSGALQVRMAGVARDDGALGDIIAVESKASGRLIQAVVRSAKSVEVLLR